MHAGGGGEGGNKPDVCGFGLKWHWIKTVYQQ